MTGQEYFVTMNLDDLDFENLDLDEPENRKRLREYAARADARGAKATELERENAFLKAGIDLSSRLGKAFASTYAGELNDVEAIRTDAKDFDPRIVVGPETAAASGAGAQQQEQGQQVDNGSSERQGLADGLSGTETSSGDIKAESLATARRVIADGKEVGVGAGELIAIRARAVHEGKLQALDQFGRQVN
jgi:hypothetical protein